MYKPSLKSKKAISGVITIASLLLVSIIAIAYLQNWFLTYESDMIANSDNSVSKHDVQLMYLDSNKLYVRNINPRSFLYSNVKIGDTLCGVSGTISNGMNTLSIGNCTYGMSVGPQTVELFTNSDVIGTTLLLTNPFTYNSCSLDSITINHGESYTYYNSSLVPYGTSCTSISRTCSDGTLSGDSSYNESSCSVEGQDTMPEVFSFTNQTDVALSTLVSSDIVTPTGFEGPLSVGITGDGSPQLSVDSGAWTTSTTINPGETLQIRLTSAGAGEIPYTATLTFGDYNYTWSVTTGAGVSYSLRFNDDDNAYLSWTPVSEGNRRTWTWSGWVKLSNVGSSHFTLFAADDGSTDEALHILSPGSDNRVRFLGQAGGTNFDLVTTQKFNDSSDWGHFVVSFDSTQTTSSDRIKIYYNGVQITAFDSETYPSQNYASQFGDSSSEFDIGVRRQSGSYNSYADGYFSEVHFIDGQALNASYFGEEDSNGNWVPKDLDTTTYNLSSNLDVNSGTWTGDTSYFTLGTNSVTALGDGVSSNIGSVVYDTTFSGDFSVAYTMSGSYTYAKIGIAEKSVVDANWTSGDQFGGLGGASEGVIWAQSEYRYTQRYLSDGPLGFDWRGATGASAAGDSFVLKREGSVITLYKNGVLDYTFSEPIEGDAKVIFTSVYNPTWSSVTITDYSALSGGYGTNGFYLPFNDSMNLGHDQSDSRKDPYNVLLIHSNETDGDTTFLDYTGSHTITYSGNPIHNTSTAKFGSSSIYFDGSAEYLTTTDSNDFEFGTGDFTIDFWIYVIGSTDTNDLITKRDSQSVEGFTIYKTSGAGSNQYALYATSAGSSWDVCGQTFGAIHYNAWDHIAVTRAGNTIYLFENGTLQDTCTSTASFHDAPTALSIARDIDGDPFKGHMDEIRILKGKALWTSNFTLPTAPANPVNKPLNDFTLVNIDEGEGLLIHSNTTDGNTIFFDSSTNAHIISKTGNVHHESNQSKFGNTSVYFDGSGDYLSIASSSDWAFGTGDFTIDFWIYDPLDIPGSGINVNVPLINADYSGGSGWLLYYYPTGNLHFQVGSGGAYSYFNLASSSDIVDNSWNHFAFTREDSVLKMYVNGVSQSFSDYSGGLHTYNFVYSGDLELGYESSQNAYLNGYLDEFRLIKGKALWTNASFTLPTSPATTLDALSTDQMIDSPTNNFATWSSTDKDSGVTLSNGNLEFDGASAWKSGRATMSMTEGKWYFEATPIEGINYFEVGVAESSAALTNYLGYSSSAWILQADTSVNTRGMTNNVQTNFGDDTSVLGDVFMVAMDMDNNKVWFGKNGAWFSSGDPEAGSGEQYSSLPSELYFAYSAFDKLISTNFGQGGQSGLTYYSDAGGYFKYEPPTGFRALSQDNLDYLAGLKCTLDGTTLENGSSATFYTATSVPFGSSCLSQTRTCNEGTLDGSDTYAYSSCIVSYNISNSLLFNKVDTSYLSRTFVNTATNGTKGTISLWVKRGNLADTTTSGAQAIFSSPEGSSSMLLGFDSGSWWGSNDNNIILGDYGGTWYKRFADNYISESSNWSNLVIVWDSSLSTASDRVKLWQDGVELVSTAESNLAQNTIMDFGKSGSTITFGGRVNVGDKYFDGYLSEVHFIDGAALNASYFGQEDSSGNWVPKYYEGTYGTNGFYLPFNDSMNLGYDYSDSRKDPYNVLLIHSNDTDDSTTFLDYTGRHTITTNGNVKHETNESKFGDSSIYFDGTGDYLTMPDSVDWDFSNDFTIDFWVYLNANTYQYFLTHRAYSATTGYWGVFTAGAGDTRINFQAYNSANADTFTVASTTSLDLNKWYHIAVVRNGNNGYLFINGTLESTDTSAAGDISGMSSTLDVGFMSGYGGYTNGYLDEIRITKGKALWTNASFTPPTAPESPTTKPNNDWTVNNIDEGGGLLIHSNNTDGSVAFTDSSGNAYGITNSGVSHSTDTKVLNSSSMKFEGSNSEYLYVSDSSILDIGTNDFTIDFWVNFSTLSAYSCSGAASWFAAHDTSSDFQVSYYYSLNQLHVDIGASAETTVSWSPSTNIWYHLAITRNNGNVSAYVDGSRISTWTDTESIPSGGLYLGRNYVDPCYFDGYMDEIRIIKGKALWTNASFTPPTSPADSINTTSINQMIDTPTNNFATLNPADGHSSLTYAFGNLKLTGAGAASDMFARATQGTNSGKWYYEFTKHTTGYGDKLGWADKYDTDWVAGSANLDYSWAWSTDGTTFYSRDTTGATTTTISPGALAVGEVGMVAVDLSGGNGQGKIWFGKNGQWFNSGDPSSDSNPLRDKMNWSTTYLYPFMWLDYNMAHTMNFGQGGQSGLTYYPTSGGRFRYEPPTGFKALSTANTN